MSNPWIIDEGDFHELETRDEQMRILVRYAILAPSGHNTQPWSFRMTAGGVEVHADTSRRLLIVDRTDRELLMSIGAAITNFRVAAAHFGFDTTVAYDSRSIESTPVATILVCETCAPDRELAALFPAIRQRHTNREPYDEQPIEPQALRAIFDVFDANPDTLRLIRPRDKQRVAECVETADRALMARPAYRAEVADWVGSGDERSDGLSAEALGMPRILASVAPWLIRNFDGGGLQARRDVELTRTASMLILVTSDDDRISLVKAGETFELLLLTITRSGLQYSVLSAPVDLDESRTQLRQLIGSARQPQLLLRVGSAARIAHATPRRPVENVIS
jgi:nitroreductase